MCVIGRGAWTAAFACSNRIQTGGMWLRHVLGRWWSFGRACETSQLWACRRGACLLTTRSLAYSTTDCGTTALCLGSMLMVRLLGPGARLWVQAGARAGAEQGKQQPGSSEQQLQELLASVLFVGALAFPAELRVGTQGREGAARAEAGSEGACTSGDLPARWCRMRLSALRAVLGASGGGGSGGGGGGQGELGELEAVCRVAGGWEPEPGERRALLQRGRRRLVGAVWGGETEGSGEAV